ncbi:MAG TPA: beta-N-acetylhexosaminidase, partial [Puia sp.]
MKFFLFGLLICGFTATAQVNIIPQPVSVKMPRKMGDFSFSRSTKIVLKGGGLENSVQFFNDYLKEYYGFSLETTMEAKGNNNLILKDERLGDSIPGAYHLSVNQKGISIGGDNETGVFYGIQTLIQLLPMPDGTKPLSIPYVQIDDKPRFAYRGLMLDVGRHFMPVPFVKKFIDYLALHKMNEFHWHLTEDQGWRIEIKKYPRLTEVGAWRDGTVIGGRPWKGNDNIRYGGFYTQDQIRDVVAYASKRY